MHWNGIYKSEHLIITSRFTNAIAFNPPVPVGTDSGLEFCLPFACSLAFLYVVLSHQICIQWCIYSKWKRHIRYGSYIAWHACICTQILHTHNSFGAMNTASKRATGSLLNSIFQMLLFTRHKLKWERINDTKQIYNSNNPRRKKSLESWQVFVWI